MGHAVPGEATTTLAAGDHALWTTGGGFVGGSSITISGPSGAVAPVGEPETEGTTTITRDGRSFDPQVGFTAPSSGSYTIRVDGAASAREVLLGPAPEAVNRGLLVIAVGVYGAGAVAVAGVVFLVVGLTDRRRAAKEPLAAGGVTGA